VDPFIGGRFIVKLADRWSLVARGDIGGFNVGSELAWNVIGTVDYRMTDHASLLVGYRHFDIDYEDGRFSFDTVYTGPFLALNFTF
jgi:hypothetical protein